MGGRHGWEVAIRVLMGSKANGVRARRESALRSHNEEGGCARAQKHAGVGDHLAHAVTPQYFARFQPFALYPGPVFMSAEIFALNCRS